MMHRITAFLISGQFDFALFLHHLREGTAAKVLVHNLHTFGWKHVVLNELAPSAWLTPAGVFTWTLFKPEALGWCSHVLIAAAMGRIARVSPRMMFLIAFTLEVHFFAAVNATFANPGNAALDIATYVLGSIWTVRLISPVSAPRKVWVPLLEFLFWLFIFLVDRRIVQMFFAQGEITWASRVVTGLVLAGFGILVGGMFRRTKMVAALGLIAAWMGFAFGEITGLMKSYADAEWTPENAWFMLILFGVLLSVAAGRRYLATIR